MQDKNNMEISPEYDKSYNYASMVVFFYFNGGKPQVLIVYYDQDGKVEIRIPGGTVQPLDIVEGINRVLELNSVISDDYKGKVLWVIDEISNTIAPDYKSTIDALEKDFENGKIKETDFRSTGNRILNDVMKKIIWHLRNTRVSKNVLELIGEYSRKETAIREVRQETETHNVGEMELCNFSWKGMHQRCTYVCCKAESPDSYHGTGDDDLWSSEIRYIDDVINEISKTHEGLLQSAIKKALEKKMHPRVEELRYYLTASD